MKGLKAQKNCKYQGKTTFFFKNVKIKQIQRNIPSRFFVKSANFDEIKKKTNHFNFQESSDFHKV